VLVGFTLFVLLACDLMGRWGRAPRALGREPVSPRPR
jgi:hypothetical protein